MAGSPSDGRSLIDHRLRLIIINLRPSMARRAGVWTDRIDDLTSNGRLAWRIALEQVVDEDAGPTSDWAAGTLDTEHQHSLDERSVLIALSDDLHALGQLTPSQDQLWVRNLEGALEMLVRSGQPMCPQSVVVLDMLLSSPVRMPAVCGELGRFVRHAGRVGVRPVAPAAAAALDEAGLRRIVDSAGPR